MKRLKELREKNNLTQKELGLKLNVSQNTISQWEQGTRDIDTATLSKFADFFSVTTDYLLERTDVLSPTTSKENQDFKKKLDALPADKRQAIEILMGFNEQAALPEKMSYFSIKHIGKH